MPKLPTLLLLSIFALATLAADANPVVAKLDLAKIFKRYDKVNDLQAALDEKFAARRKELEKGYAALPENNLIKKEVQRKKQLDAQADKLDNDIADARADAIREALTAIQSATEQSAQARKAAFVIRADDGEDITRPVKYKRSPPPKLDSNDAAKLIDDFKKDIVLYRLNPKQDFPANWSNPIDLTPDILKILNEKADAK